MASLPPICSQPLVAKLRLKDDRVLSRRGPGMGPVLSLGWAWPAPPQGHHFLQGPARTGLCSLRPNSRPPGIRADILCHTDSPASRGSLAPLPRRALDLESRVVGLRPSLTACSSVSKQVLGPS